MTARRGFDDQAVSHFLRSSEFERLKWRMNHVINR